MNIQPVSALNSNIYRNNMPAKNKTEAVFTGETHQNEEKLKNALKALAISSAIAFSPALVSCEKHEIEDCDHPNHINPPITNPDPNEPTDTVKTGKTYEIPEYSMPRYKVLDNDTTYFGNVKFSAGIVHVPYNAHKSAELRTVSDMIAVMGLKTERANTEYLAPRAFNYNEIPAQISWLNEKTGSVNQLKYNGYDSKNNFVKMDLITIPEDNTPVQRQLQLTSAGSNKLLVNVFDKDGENKISEYLLTLDGDKITQLNMNESGKFTKTFEYSNSGTGTSVITENLDGVTSKLSNFKILTAISEEK